MGVFVLFFFAAFILNHSEALAAGSKKKNKVRNAETVEEEALEALPDTPPPPPDVDHEFFISSLRLDALRSISMSSWSIQVGYQYTIVTNQIQIGLLGSLDFTAQKGGGTYTNATALGGFTFNFPEGENLRQAFFISAYAGAQGTNTTATNLQFELLVLFGKRFPLNKHLLYHPQVGLEFFGTDLLIQVNLLSLSLVL